MSHVQFETLDMMILSYNFDFGLVTIPTHLISISAFMGKLFTATHLKNTSKYVPQVAFRLIYLRSGGLQISPVLRIHLVHLGVIFHVRQINVDFHHVVEAGPSLV